MSCSAGVQLGCCFCCCDSGLLQGGRLVVLRGAVLRDGSRSPSLHGQETHGHV